MRLSKLFKEPKILLLTAILLLGFIVRLYRIDNPIADWHSWRQADTSAVSRNFVTGGFDLLHPRFDDISNVPTRIYDNPLGYRFVEFPIYNVIQAVSYKMIGILTLEEWGRLTSIFASLISAVFLYLILKKRFNFTIAFFASFFFLFLPFNIYYSRTILPDPLMVTATLGATYFFQLFMENINKKSKSTKYLVLSLILMMTALLLKPYALFFIFPMLYLSYEKYGFSLFKNKTLWIFAILSLVPLGLWRLWMLQYPEGIPQSAWLFNENGIRFRPSFFYWIFYQRLTKLMLGFVGLPLFVIGLVTKINKNFYFVASFFFSSLLYMTVIATGNVQHDYYQILIIPSVAIILGVGVNTILNIKRVSKYILFFIIFILIGGSFIISGNYIKDYFNINNRSIIAAGIAVDKLTPKDALIVANYNGDSSLLYQTKRKGWTSFETSIPLLIEKGASYLVLVNPTPVDLEIGKTYKIVASTSQYVIFDLLKKP